MVEMELEDFMEEVKYQMTEYEILDEEMIKQWETKARKWTKDHFDRGFMVRRGDDILLSLRDEDVMEELALKFYKAVKEEKLKEYWVRFNIFK